VFNGNLQVINGTLLVSNAFTFSGALSSSAIVSGSNPINIQGTSTVVSGSPAGFTATLRITGGSTIAKGFFDGPVEVALGATLNLIPLSVETATQMNGALTVNGTLTGNFFIFRGPTFTNNGSVTPNIEFQGTIQSIAGNGNWNSVTIFDGATVSPSPATSFAGNIHIRTTGTLLLNNPLTFTGILSTGGGVVNGNAPLQTQGTSTVQAGASSAGPLFTAPLKVLSGTTTASGILDGPVEVRGHQWGHNDRPSLSIQGGDFH
jgi:hypothetical protein